MRTLQFAASFLMCTTALPAQEPPKAPDSGASHGAVVRTPAGSLVIDKVQLSERWPPACKPVQPQRCDQAEKGQRLLVISLVQEDPDAKILIDKESQDAYVIAGEGSRARRGGVATRVEFDAGKVKSFDFISFTVPTTAAEFALVWPGNEPIKLRVGGATAVK